MTNAFLKNVQKMPAGEKEKALKAILDGTVKAGPAPAPLKQYPAALKSGNVLDITLS